MESSENTCKFVLAWVGRCKNPAVEGGFCSKHATVKCSSCGDQATRECDETFGLVCGGSLCDNCEHEIAPDGTNGGSSIHIRKGTQRFKPWWLQNDQEKIEGEYLMLKRRMAFYDHITKLVVRQGGFCDPNGREDYENRKIMVAKKIEEFKAIHPEVVKKEV